MNKLITFFLLSFCFNLYSQSTIDGIFILKSSIYFDKFSITNDASYSKKEIVDFEGFIKDVNIKPDTLKSNMDESFVFLCLNISDTNQIKCKNGFCHFVYFYSGKESYTKLIICINKDTGQIYKLAGFNQLDIAGFIEVIQNQYDYSKINKSKKKIIKEIWIDGLDLNCLINSIGKRHDIKKYPCTYRSSDNITIIK